MKKVFVTGITGFLGSQIARSLLKKDVIVYGLKRESSQLNNLLDIETKVHLVHWEEVNDSQFFKDKNFDGIVHTQTDYGKHGDYEKVLLANLTMPLSLLKLAQENEIPKFINIDSFSSKITGYEYLPYYHLSKKNFIEWAMKTIDIDSPTCFSTLRLEHLYGPYDSSNKFIPFVINALLEKRTHIDFTEGLQRRDFVFSEDVAQAVECVLLKQTKPFEEFAVGTSETYSIQEMIILCAKLIGNKETRLNFGALDMRKNELMESKADHSSLIKLGWKPRFNLEAGLERTIKYFQTK